MGRTAALAETTETVHWQRLLLGVGIASATYLVMFQPVVASFRALEAGWARDVRIESEITTLAKRNASLEKEIKAANVRLGAKAGQVASLSRQLVALQKKERALSAQISVSSVTAPTLPSVGSAPQVSTVTGASGLP